MLVLCEIFHWVGILPNEKCMDYLRTKIIHSRTFDFKLRNRINMMKINGKIVYVEK